MVTIWKEAGRGITPEEVAAAGSVMRARRRRRY